MARLQTKKNVIQAKENTRPSLDSYRIIRRLFDDDCRIHLGVGVSSIYNLLPRLFKYPAPMITAMNKDRRLDK